MAMLRKILSPEDIRAGERIEQQRSEGKQRIKDHIRKKEVTVASDGEADITRADVQAGRRILASEVRTKLKRMNPNLQFEVSVNFPEITGIYFVTNAVDPMTLKRPWKRHVCGMPTAGMVNEFSTIVPKLVRVPDPDVALHWQTVSEMKMEVRGWRTVLARLIQEGILTEPEANREFGIAAGRSSAKWQAVIH